MSEKRYDKVDFVMLDAGEPLPAGLELLTYANRPCYCEHRNSVDARRGLRTLTRRAGGNALFNVSSRYIDSVTWRYYYECWGTPGVVARPNPRGAYTKEDLVRFFHAPAQGPTTGERISNEWAAEYDKKQKWISRFVAFMFCYGTLCFLIAAAIFISTL